MYMTSIYVNWGKDIIKLTWKAEKQCPKNNLITSVHSFCFYKNKLLLVNLNDRGWDIPGGHIESNETPMQCIKREAMEEAYIEGKLHYLGYIVIDHRENPNWKADSPYPKVGYQLFYRMDIDKIYPFAGEFEASQRVFINPMEISEYHHDWSDFYQHILDYAQDFST